MQQALKLKEKNRFQQDEEKNVQTVIETETDLTDQKVNLELSERTVTTTKTEKIVNGEKKKLIDIDESEKVQEVSYPRPDNIYQKKTEKIQSESSEEEKDSKNKTQGFSRPKVVVLKLEAPEKDFSAESYQVPETAARDELRPTIKFGSTEKNSSGSFVQALVESAVDQVFEEFSNTESREFGENTWSSSTVETSYTRGQRDESQEEGENRESYAEEEAFDLDFLSEESPYEKQEELSISDQDLFEVLNRTEVSRSYGFLEDSLNDFEGLESYSFLSEGVLKAEYEAQKNDKGVSDRVFVSLDSLTEQESLSGSEVVEYLGSETGLDATVAEIPYFSENSGGSWETGWNSFDMVLQMRDMDFQEMEYMVSDPGETADTPARKSIDNRFDSSKVLEFRESQEWSNHDGGYEASEKTKNAWTEKYGEEVLELDPMERGIYAAIVEENEFRGSDIDFTDLNLENGEFLEEVYRETRNRKNYLEGFRPEGGGLDSARALS